MKTDVLRLHLEGELAHGLQEGEALDVARRAADLGDEHVHVLAAGVDALLDLVGDVRDHLHGLAEIHPAPLLLDDALVDLARAQAVQAGKFPAREALVVAQVEVRLGAVLQHIHLAVLVRAHRPRVDVQVGVEFLDADGQAPELKQRAERRRREPLAKRGNHSAGHEDVFHPRGINVCARAAQDSSNGPVPAAALPEQEPDRRGAPDQEDPEKQQPQRRPEQPEEHPQDDGRRKRCAGNDKPMGILRKRIEHAAD
jgi:hypothetical protein